MVEREQGRLVLTVSQDLDCPGLPEQAYPVCTCDEGFIMAGFTVRKFLVREVDSWCTSDRVCHFSAQAAG